MKRLDNPLKITNINNSKTGSGKLTHKVLVEGLLVGKQGTYSETIEAYVCPTGTDELVLGTPWIKEHNPHID